MYDAIVIGAGPGGYECARIIGDLGGKVAIVEKDKMGGTCTNYGCIPTKALHASASFFHSISNSSNYGFSASPPIVELSKLIERKQKVVDMMSRGVQRILDTSKVETIMGEAKIENKNTVAVNGQKYETKNIVIATGAKPRLLPGIQLSEFVITSKEALELKELPKSIVIIGAGYIGCEFASIFASLGTKVTILESLPRIIFNEDLDISSELAKSMRRKNVEMFTDSKVLGVEGNKVTFQNKDGQKTIEADRILIAVGVDSNFDRNEMDSVGVKYNKGILVNDKMQTSVENIYAIGDVTEKIKLAHVAYAHAEVAACNIMGKEMHIDESAIPSAMFTIPEVASVGIKDPSMKSATFNFAASGKARAMGEPEGFVKVFHENGFLKGFCAIGAHSSDLVAEATLAIKNKLTLDQIRHTIHVHPTLSEAFWDAVKKVLEEQKLDRAYQFS